MIKSPETAENTRQELDHHRELPFIVRVGRRAMGFYPSRDDREALRQHDLGPAGRIIENIYTAIRYDQASNYEKLDASIEKALGVVPELGGLAWGTPPEPSTSVKSTYATRPAPIDEHIRKAVEEVFALKDHTAGLEGVDNISFVMPNYNKLRTSNEQAEAADSIGVLALNGDSITAGVMVARESLSQLAPESLEVLEEVTAQVSNQAFHDYLRVKPDNIG